MRVLFDHQIMDAQVRGGVSRYFYQLAAAMEKEGLARVRLPPIYSDNEYFQPFAARPPRLVRTVRKLRLTNRELERVWRKAKSRHNVRAMIDELAKQNFDLFHPTYYDPYFLTSLHGRPFVLTIYDMIHEIFPHYFQPDDRTSERKAMLARAATRIIAISASTKADIVQHLKIDPDKIDVVPLANPLEAASEELPVPESFILYVGERGRYKNFRTLLLAFASLAADAPDLHLVCASQKPFSPVERDILKGLGLEERCLQIAATDGQLVYLYKNAALFAYPSLYEGFGLPVLEAFACGCPAVLSRTSSFPEIAGDAALYFDPEDVLSMREALAKVLHDRALRTALAERGKERLARFSWAATASQTAAVYLKCLGES